MPPEQLREKERALEVGVDHVVPFGLGDFGHRLEQGAAGVVDQEVEVAQPFRRALECGVDAVLRAQIERDRNGLALDLGQREVVTFSRQRHGNGAAETARRSSY